jgi:hypothetical protein
MVILGIDFLRTHSLTVGPGTCRRVQASGRVFPDMAVTSSPTASVIPGTELLPVSSSPSSEPPSAAAEVKVPSRLSAAAFSAGKAASATPPTPAAHQQVGHSSAVPAKRQLFQPILQSVPPWSASCPCFSSSSSSGTRTW